jgi:hypothetical protein
VRTGATLLQAPGANAPWFLRGDFALETPMHYRCLTAVAIASVASLCACTDQPTTPVQDGTLAATVEPRMANSSSARFSDPFNSFNTSRWTKSTYPIPEMLGGASFKAANVAVQNGRLELTLPAKSFNGGQIETKAKYGFGSYSATMQCPNVTGAYCTVFSYDHRTEDEIDIEIYKQSGKWYVEFTVWSSGRRVCTPYKMTPSFNPSTAMHTYRYDYSSGKVRFFVDGKEQTQAACSYSRRPLRTPPTSQMTFLLAAWWPQWLLGSQQSTAKKMYVESASYTP